MNDDQFDYWSRTLATPARLADGEPLLSPRLDRVARVLDAVVLWRMDEVALPAPQPSL